MESFSLRARWVVPAAAPPIENGFVTVSSGGRISDVGKHTTGSPAHARDLGDAVIVPGLVNAHAHLELSGCAGMLREGADFVSWLEEVEQLKRRITADHAHRSTKAAIAAMAAAGISSVGDISSCGVSAGYLCRAGLRAVVYLEIINPVPGLAWASAWRLESSLRRAGLPCPRVRYGISPHAPYSVSPALYRRCGEIARRFRTPLCSHIAESREELHYLAGGEGRMREFLGGKILHRFFAPPPRCTPVNFVKKLGMLGPSMSLIHCNYPTEDEISEIGRSGASVVYCPSSHRFFQHAPYPLERMTGAGVNVALGTDSLASSDGVSILSEMRRVAETHPHAGEEQIVRMATINGARALGLSGEIGSIERGKSADICAMRLPAGERDWRTIVHCDCEILLTMVGGEIIFPRGCRSGGGES